MRTSGKTWWGEFTNPIPGVTKINLNLKETIINPDKNELPPTHLGWNGRLNGPADNYLSSCMSCHMTAEAPQKSPNSPLFQEPQKVPPIGSKEWMRWFQNLKCATPFDSDAYSTDFSLQLAASLQNFSIWKNEALKLKSDSYKKNTMLQKTKPEIEYSIRRD